MNEPTEFGPLNEALARRYGIAGGGPVSTFATDAFPVIDISDSGIDPELYFLTGGFRCVGWAFQAASVAERSQVMIINPANSGVMAVLESIEVLTNAANMAVFGYLQVNDAAVAGPDSLLVTKSCIDLRSRGTGGTPGFPTCRLGIRRSPVATAALGTDAFVTHANNTTPVRIDGPFVLPPNSRVGLYGGADNQNLQGMFRWRERRLTSWEQIAG